MVRNNTYIGRALRNAVGITVLVIVLVGGASATPAEQWNKTFGGAGYDVAYSIQQTSDGGYIIAGATTSYGAGNWEAWLIKTDANGNQQWNKTFGGAGSFYAYSIQQTSDGGYIIAGTSSTWPGNGFWLIKTDVNGNQQWNRKFLKTGYDVAYSVQQTSDGGYIILGTVGAGAYNDVWLIKTDDNGYQQWNKTFGGTEYDETNSVQQTSDGGYVIAGSSYTFTYGGTYGNYHSDAWVIKTDANGYQQWNKTLGVTTVEKANSVQQTQDGGYIIAGGTRNISYYDAWLIKTDVNGNQQWSKTFGVQSAEGAKSVRETSDGGYIIIGRTYTGGFWVGWLIKTDAKGDKQWNMTFGGTSDKWFNSVQQTSDGGYIIAGSTYTYGAFNDAWLIKVSDEAGTISGPVHNINKSINYTSIQSAINGASPGDEIRVDSGTYYENVIINKQLILRGIDTGAGIPIVDAMGKGSAITLSVNGIILETFNTINSSSRLYAGIKVISNNNVIVGNSASNNENGIWLSSSKNNVLSNNNATSNGEGIMLSHSSNNTLSNNNALNNGDGIYLYSSSNNTLMNNMMVGNRYNFFLNGESSSHFDNQIDTGNIVDGKPIYYIKSARDTVYDSSTNAVTFYCISCVNVTIKDMNLNKNGAGVFFWNTTHSRIQNISSSNNYVGIYLFFSENNTLSGSNIANNLDGIKLYSSSNNNTLSGNKASNNNNGIRLYDSRNNMLSGNNASNNAYGIYLQVGSINNKIYHNNLIKNTNQAYDNIGTNLWDNGYPSGGNYWSDYTNTDIRSGEYQDQPGSDGLGDTPYPILGGSSVDRYPLVIPYTGTPTLLPGKITAISTWPQDPMYRQKYTVTLNLYNPNSVVQDYKLGLKNDGSITTCSPLDSGLHTVSAYETSGYSFDCTTNWKWIPDDKVGFTDLGLSLTQIGMEEIAEKIITENPLISIADSMWSIYLTLELSGQIEKNKPYYVDLNSESTPEIIFDSSVNRDIIVNVPSSKKFWLTSSVVYDLGSTGLTMIGVLTGAATGGLASIPFLVTEALNVVSSWTFYQQAYDPDFNYTTVQKPIPMYLPELDAVPEGDAKEFALAYADVASLRNATLVAYVRYDGARIDNQSDYMLMQLEAANNYTLQAMQKMPEVVKYYKLLTSSMEPMTDEQIQHARTEIQTNGLPQAEIDILTRNGLGDSVENITQMILNTSPEVYRNPKNYTKYLDFQTAILANDSAGYTSEIIRIKVEDKGYSITTASDVDIAYLENLKSQIQLGIDQGKATPDVKAQINEMIGKSSEVLEKTNNLTYKPYYEFAVNALAIFQTLDNTPPEITINTPVNASNYILNQSVIANWQAIDIESGVASITSSVPNGTPIDTASVGTKTFNVDATDNAGNSAAKTVTYYIRYSYGGILQPINADGSSIFKLGSIVPVKFQLTNASGNFVTNAVAKIYVAKIGSGITGPEMEATSTSAATVGNLFRYDSTSNQYIFNLRTKSLSTGTWQIRISLDDGTSKYTNISLK